MKRNRKSQSAALRLAPALKALFLCLFFGGAAVGYVWQQRKLHDLARLQRSLEMQRDQLRRENRLLSIQLADLRLPDRLQERVRHLRLAIGPASPNQIVRLPEPAATADAQVHDPLIAGRPEAYSGHLTTD
ncbi:MAG TPA: hypothetical protein DCM86_05750 [Verrucomicrobiales bacterium]|nr:hypothetical protein [Verrucomicrobiales bacterium]